MDLVLLMHTFATWALVGLIWTIQCVHYPLFARVGEAQFADYHREHTTRIAWVVIPLMLTELVTAAMLVWAPPPGISVVLAWAGAALVGAIWLVTAVVQVPQHHTLSQRMAPRTIAALVNGNWLRTALWTARGVVTGWMLTAAVV